MSSKVATDQSETNDLEERVRAIVIEAGFVPVLRAIRELNLPQCWLAGGAVRNTVWKHLYGNDCKLEVKDFDVVFFDHKATRETEQQAQAILASKFPQHKFDVKNEASFGVWREWRFQFTSTEHAILHWLHTATATGVQLSDDDRITVYAPFGLSDLFSGIVRTTPAQDGHPAAEIKAQEFISQCKKLRVCPSMTVNFATGQDANSAANIMRKAAEWLIVRDARQWTPELFTENWAQQYIDRGELLIAKIKERPVGIAILDGEDKTYWSEDKKGEALYLHKIAIEREFASKGIPQTIIESAAKHAQQKGCRYLRLNCWQRPVLVQLYWQCGFVEVYRRAAKDDRGLHCSTVGMQRKLFNHHG